MMSYSLRVLLVPWFSRCPATLDVAKNMALPSSTPFDATCLGGSSNIPNSFVHVPNLLASGWWATGPRLPRLARGGAVMGWFGTVLRNMRPITAPNSPVLSPSLCKFVYHLPRCLDSFARHCTTFSLRSGSWQTVQNGLRLYPKALRALGLMTFSALLHTQPSHIRSIPTPNVSSCVP